MKLDKTAETLLTILNSVPVSFYENLTESEAHDLVSLADEISEKLGVDFVQAEIRDAIMSNTDYDVH